MRQLNSKRYSTSLMSTFPSNLNTSSLEDISLADLFSVADEIGNKYQTSREVLSQQAAIEREQNIFRARALGFVGTDEEVLAQWWDS